MKKVLYIFIILAVLGGVFYWYSTTQASVGSLNIYSGEVEILRGSDSQSGRTGTAIRLNDSLRVREGSRVAIVLKDGSEIRLEGGTVIEVSELEYQGEQVRRAAFKLTAGRVWSKVEPLSREGDFEVETPTVVASIRGTSFNFDNFEEIYQVYVFRSEIACALQEDRLNEKLVTEGQVFIMRKDYLEEDFAFGPIVAPDDFFDDWIIFNQGLDGRGDYPFEEEAEGIFEEPFESDGGIDQNGTGGFPDGSTQTIPDSAPPSSPSAPPAGSDTPVVSQKTLTSLTLSSANNVRTIDPQQTILLRVRADYSDGSSSEVGGSVTWQQNPELGRFDPGGYYAGILSGTTIVRARLNNVISNNLEITIREATRLISLSVSCAPVSSQQTATRASFGSQCQAIANYSNQTSVDVTNQATWSASGTAEGTITNSGYYTPGNPGQDTVTAVYGGLSNSTTVSTSENYY